MSVHRRACAGLLAALSLSFCGLSAAAPIVTYSNPEKTFDAKEKKPYLQANSDDDGYVAITARVVAPEGVPCITPTTTDTRDNFFKQGSLELALSAVVEGFQEISTNPIPIATYVAKDADGRYCLSPWTLPILLVPNTRFGAQGPVGSPEPAITLQVTSVSGEQERISGYAQALLGAASVVATGGAATTVVGLTNAANSAVITKLSEEFTKRTRGNSTQPVPISLTWDEIRSGLRTVRVRFWEADPLCPHVFSCESIEQTVTRVHGAPVEQNAKRVLDVVFSIETRRSLFVSDAALTADSFLPKKGLDISGDRILNFPKGPASSPVYPNLFQRINNEAPTLSKAVASDPIKCSSVLTTLKNIGLNRVDRALVMAAYLDEAKPGWRKDDGYKNKCFSLDNTVPQILTAIDPSYFPGPPIVFRNLDIAQEAYEVSDWDPRLEGLVTRLQAAFFGQPEQRGSAFSALRKSDTPFNWQGDGAPLAPATLTAQRDAFVALDPVSAGCIFIPDGRVASALADGTTTMRAMMVFVGNHKVPQVYLLTADFDVKAPNPLLALTTQTMSPAYRGYATAIRNAKFDARSECTSKIGKYLE